jgi:hypothetical protein
MTQLTDQDAKEIKSAIADLTTAVTSLREEMRIGFTEIKGKIDTLDSRVTAVEGRLTAVEGRLTGLDNRLWGFGMLILGTALTVLGKVFFFPNP